MRTTFSFTNAMAAVGNGVIKFKTNTPIGQKMTIEMLIFDGLDEDGDTKDKDPNIGDNFYRRCKQHKRGRNESVFHGRCTRNNHSWRC